MCISITSIYNTPEWYKHTQTHTCVYVHAYKHTWRGVYVQTLGFLPPNTGIFAMKCNLNFGLIVTKFAFMAKGQSVLDGQKGAGHCTQV